MSLFTQRKTHDEWGEYLAAPGRKLTIVEFVALELSNLHAILLDVHVGLGLNPSVPPAGHLDRLQRLLDRLVGHVTVPRPEQVRPAINGADHGIRLVGKIDRPLTAPEEGG